MMVQQIDRKQLKRDSRALLRTAQVAPMAMTALYLGLVLVLDAADVVSGGSAALGIGSLLSTFVSVLTWLVGIVLSAGFVLYCMAIRRGERAVVHAVRYPRHRGRLPLPLRPVQSL